MIERAQGCKYIDSTKRPQLNTLVKFVRSVKSEQYVQYVKRQG